MIRSGSHICSPANFIAILLLAGCGSACTHDRAMTPEEMKDHWSRMNGSKLETLDWFQDARFGMFIHFGIYSVPAGVWKGKTMLEYDRPPWLPAWLQHVAEIPREEYALIAKDFNPERFNADSIVRLAVDAGMKYLVITAKHHDGFALYNSRVSEFDVIDATPFGRDIVEEFHTACKKNGLKFGIYYSQALDWADGGDCQYALARKSYLEEGKDLHPWGANLWDPSPNSFGQYLERKAYPQVKELLRNYPDMVCLWYDVPRFLRPVQSYEFYRIAFDIQPAMIINSRVGNDFGDYYITGDNLIPEDPESIGMPWETVGTINNTWAYSSYDRDWKSVKELLFWLIEIASKGGNYMLNIGPGGDGTVPEESAERLRAMGDWLKMNGESIYGTQAWICSHEGPTIIHMAGTVRRRKEGFHAEITPDDIWFTAKGNTVYAIGLEEPPNGRLLIRSFAGKKVISVGMLGHDDKVPWQLNDSGLILELPQKSDNSIGYVLKVILET